MPTTNSSTSSSDPPPNAARRWRQALVALAVGCVLMPLVVAAAIVVADPYGTGRFAVSSRREVPPQGPRTAHVSRLRDPAFDSAIIGNSKMQLLSPAMLSRATGFSFLSLTMPGAGVGEQRAVLARFGHHRRPRALIIGVDAYTCARGPGLLRREPFPDWLYAPEDWRYLAGLVRLYSAEAAVRRWSTLLRGEELAGRDGYRDYEAGRTWTDALVPVIRGGHPQPLARVAGRFPGLEAWAEVLDTLPPETLVVFVLPPVFAPLMPAVGSAEHKASEACKASLAALAGSRPRTAVVDWYRDTPETRDPASFWDATHMRASLARRVESDIAIAFARVARVARAETVRNRASIPGRS